ncbi:hypothetical protein OIV83_000287 [Microbotryomycetes sp. JL201]|nr:hypothetical protein OIV83_000287 [Microbotryomycetes sp. JL201]
MTFIAQNPVIDYLKSLDSIRARCNKVYDLAQRDELDYWTIDLSKQDDIVTFVCQLIERDYGADYDSIPPHGRWRHFVGNRIDPLLKQWDNDKVDNIEIARRMVDLMVSSVLMDAGAGDVWRFQPKDGGEPITRSEGLAVGSLEMFENGLFSGVETDGLARITTQQISDAMQVSDANPMTGIEGRAQLLVRLADVLQDPKNERYFSSPIDMSRRPGNIVDYLLSHSTSQQIPSPASFKIAVQIDTLWDIIVNGLAGVWPAARSKIDGIPLGDVWQVDCLKRTALEDADAFVSFHKLSQWLTYSLIEVMETILSWKIIGKEKMTGLPEYRNGGLLIDFGLLKPKMPELLQSFGLSEPVPSLLEVPPLDPSHSAVVEMRAITIIMLDKLADGIRARVGVDLTLPQVLEAGTWKAGREIAKKLRPKTGGPPFRYGAFYID